MKNEFKRCKHCKKEFKPKNKRQIYCTDNCRKKANYRKKNPLYTTICIICNQTFLPKNNNELYCSDDCKKIAKNKQSSDWIRESRKEHPDKYNNELGSKGTSPSYKMHRKADGSPDFEKEFKWSQKEKKRVLNNGRNLFKLPSYEYH